MGRTVGPWRVSEVAEEQEAGGGPERSLLATMPSFDQ